MKYIESWQQNSIGPAYTASTTIFNDGQHLREHIWRVGLVYSLCMTGSIHNSTSHSVINEALSSPSQLKEIVMHWFIVLKAILLVYRILWVGNYSHYSSLSSTSWICAPCKNCTLPMCQWKPLWSTRTTHINAIRYDYQWTGFHWALQWFVMIQRFVFCLVLIIKDNLIICYYSVIRFHSKQVNLVMHTFQ